MERAVTAPFYKQESPGFGSYAPPQPPTIGKKGAPVRALAFSGGLFDTVMQLGVVHAILVSRAEPPDVVVGVSAGAINAVALAEILQAGSDATSGEERIQAQVARFREVLEAVRESREEVISALTPDTYQVDARAPLVPTDLPIHAEDERSKRAKAVASRAGLIDLANDLLRIDVSIGTIARAARAYLGLRMAATFRDPEKRIVATAIELFRLWRIITANIGRLMPLAARLVGMTLPPSLNSILGLGPTKAKEGESRGKTAGALMFRSRWLRRPLQWIIRSLAGLTVLSPVVVSPIATLTLAATAGVTEIVRRAAGPTSAWRQVQAVVAPKDLLIVSGAFFLYTILGGLLLLWLFRRLDIDRVLAAYRIEDGIFDPHVVRSWFVRLFDPDYYGRVAMQDVVEAALTDRVPREPQRKPKHLSAYDRSSPPIHIRPLAANVKTGRLEAIDGEAPVVNALLAATAWPPLFEAQACGGAWYIDGSAVTNEPTRALANHLTSRVNDESLGVDIYPVTSLPLNATELGGTEKTYAGVVQIARRAKQLESFRDATLDRRMTTLVSRVLPGVEATWWPGRENGDPANDKKYLRASVHPIELERFRPINEKILASVTGEERRAIIVEAVADGCRSSLQVMLHQSLAKTTGPAVACRNHIAARLGGQQFLPGAGTEQADGPGLPEVCRACVLRADASVGMSETRVSLRRPTKTQHHLPEWPLAGQDFARPKQPRVATQEKQEGPPTISLLFSGGVFRGVYLAGVINALNECSIAPNIIAGSSIGSITAAMAARIFCETDTSKRRRRVVDVAATYMAIDRLVLTDRFADFIRNFTLRASASRFSLRDLDTTFRAFDRSNSETFGQEMRRVLAGLERLMYVSPFEARDLAKAWRLRKYDKGGRLLGVYLQEFLERGAVGTEVLGAEPLAILIREHVLEGTLGRAADPAAGFVDLLKERRIQFIATMTNLTRGRLDVVHVPAVRREDDGVRVIDALLASSAFPGVFRPRWSWEVNPEAIAIHQYIDGGVMDNLPIDAVAKFVNERRLANELAARPSVNGEQVPHLLFTGSLEINRPHVESDDEAADIAKYWRSTRAHAKAFTYNNKIDNYGQTQSALREIYEATGGAGMPFTPLDLEIVAVKPNWLCGTFAFHPMLGFKREEQAASIAHGCMTTLARLDKLATDHGSWVKAWGIDRPKGFQKQPQKGRDATGACWYRDASCLCPFSEQGLRQSGTSTIAPETRRALTVIYERCGQEATHNPRD